MPVDSLRRRADIALVGGLGKKAISQVINLGRIALFFLSGMVFIFSPPLQWRKILDQMRPLGPA